MAVGKNRKQTFESQSRASAEQQPPQPEVNADSESDANNRVRVWELPIKPQERQSSDFAVSMVSVAILALAGYLGWKLREVEPDVPRSRPPTADVGKITIEPKIVDTLPGVTAQSQPKPVLPSGQVIATLKAPDDEAKWVLSELPPGGERLALDSSGVYIRAKNFTEACLGRTDTSSPLKAGARSRATPSGVRSYVSSSELCATIFDEPMFEFAVDGGFRALQFGLQSGSPYVAMKRIKTPTVGLSDISRAQ